MNKHRDKASLVKVVVISAFVLTVIPLIGLPSCDRRPPATGGPVSGSVYFQEPVGETFKRGVQIYVPEIEVYLQNKAAGTETPPVVTDQFGRYQFPPQPPGTYDLRWRAQKGWAAGQHPNPIVIESGPRYPVPAQLRSEGGVIFGKISLGDGRTPWSYSELFKVDHTATVTFQNASRTATLAGPLKTNSEGRYAAAGLPRSEPTTINVQSEAAIVTRAVDASRVSMGNPVASTDIQLANQPPEIVSVVPQVGGNRVLTAAPGAVVSLVAGTRDFNNDPLQFDWSTTEGNGVIAAASAGSANWTLPNFTGQYTAYLQVRDGRGGYARQNITFTTGKVDTLFSGTVVEKGTGSPLKDADVVANGKATKTDARGFFLVRTPLADRYVLNISLAGYATFSRVGDSGITGQIWQLVKAQSETVDPKNPIDLVDKRPELDRKKLRGTRIRIPANALVGPGGAAPTGNLTANIATLAIGDDEAPGDWGAMVGSSQTNLVSYGATFVEFRDAAGTKYNLAPGMEAEVQMFAPSPMVPAAPANAKLWSYDEADGFWKESGSAAKDAASGSFIGKVKHFSTINTDIEKDDDACLKILIYPPIPTGKKLRVTNPGGAAFSQTFTGVLDAGINAVFRLPANTDVQLELLDADDSAYDGTVVLEETPGLPIPGNVVSTGPPIAGPPFPPEPYEPCKLVIMREPEAPSANAFLAFKGKGSEAEAAGYYAFIDPNNERTTLGAWWTKNGFTFDANGIPTNAARTAYLNFNDLGSGRDMYLLQRPDGTAAAYVTNYGLFNQDPVNANLARDRTGPGATVAMEYSPVEGQGNTRVVKFFVFNGADGGANAPRSTSANLDGFEAKYVPNLCLNCHAGYYNPAIDGSPTFAEVNMGSAFRELDYATYKFPDGRDLGNADATEKAAFREQNRIVKGAAANDTITIQPIKDLINGWYTAGTDDQDNNFTPPGWVGAQQGLYHDVVKQSCRTCHVALDASTDEFGLGWITYDQLKSSRGFLSYIVLCEGRLMPHSVITYRNFWLSASPHRPASLRTFTGPDWSELGPCT